MRRHLIRSIMSPRIPATLGACALVLATVAAGCHAGHRSDGSTPAPPPEVDEIVEVVGTLTDEGVECQALRSQDGTLYTLTGTTRGFSAGDRVRVRGTLARMSFCMQGTTLEVSSIERPEER